MSKIMEVVGYGAGLNGVVKNTKSEFGTLEITASPNLRREIRVDSKEDEDFQSDKYMYELFERLVSNSWLEWIDPSETGDLTSAPMLGERDRHGNVERRWAFMQYETTSPQEQLLKHGVAKFVS